MVFRAIKFVATAHQGQYRKGTKIPYIYHLMGVMKILVESGCDEKIVVAGILHDVVEDTSFTIGEVEHLFGKRVALMVAGASEPTHLRKAQDEKASWRTRKQHTIDFLTSEATIDQLLVSCADKIDNSEAILADFNQLGEGLWDRFNAPKEDQKWYYTSIAAAFEHRSNEHGTPLSSLSRRLTRNVDDIFMSRTR